MQYIIKEQVVTTHDNNAIEPQNELGSTVEEHIVILYNHIVIINRHAGLILYQTQGRKAR